MATTLKLPTSLWPHQKQAIRAIHGYLTDPNADDTAALLTLPTGTGKSGIIAWALAELPELEGHRLVLTPWAALRDQLINDIDQRFWTKLGTGSRPKSMPPVKRLPPARAIDSIAGEDPTIYVATIAAISTLENLVVADGGQVAPNFVGFDCVIVDEGHYEPAEEWSEAIRSLKLPTVLLTATPYRNDLKFFSIGSHRYRLPHHEAEAGRFLRKPEFRTIEANDAAPFATQLRALVADQFTDAGDVRVIIRCKNAPGIRDMVLALEALGESAVGIHETFTAADGDNMLKTVPKQIESVDARCWVHQNKLIEGIDDPRFKVVALFDSLRNGRAIVQQIGRVLRNPAREKTDMKALVVGRGDRDLEQVWSAYMAFDAEATSASAATMRELVETLVDSQPRSFYFGGDYRTQIDLTSPEAWTTFAYPLRTRVFRVRAGTQLDLAVVAEETREAWEGVDRSVYRLQEPDARTVVIPYVAADNSALLRTTTFVEPAFGYTLMRLSGDLLFLYDARGRIPQPVLLSCDPLPPAELTKLFPDGSSGLSMVSLSNTDTGRQAARRRSVSAAAIEDLAPNLADYGYVCTTAVGQVRTGEIRARRYIGLSRSRVTDYRPTERDYNTFSDWLDQVEAEIRGSQPSIATFGRYAASVEVPADPSPVHVLLDIDPRKFVLHGDDGKDTTLALEDTAYQIDDGEFEVVIGGTPYPVTISWEPERRAYRLDSRVRLLRYVEDRPDGRELIEAINEDQLLRIVPAQSGVMYAHRQFVAPRALKATAGILSLLTPVEHLASISTEKGLTSTDNDWEAESVFGIISALAPNTERIPEAEMSSLFDDPEILFCTDLGTEIADFVALQGDRVALIHAKASRNPAPLSASALHDVVSQALKNLPYLQPFEEREPPMGRWRTKWKAGDGGLIDRKRAGDKGPAEMWKQARAVIANPQSEREVWIVMGQALSVDRLKKELQKTKNLPVPEVLQIFSLLQTAWSATSQVGARLRIFCSP